MISKAQELVDYLNKRIADTKYNERQVQGNRVHFSLMQGNKYARIVSDGGGQRSSYAFVDADGHIYKAAGWNAPAKGIRATVDDVIRQSEGGVGFFSAPGKGFDQAAYSTIWLYR